MKPSYIKHSLLKTIRFMSSDPSPFVVNPGVDFSRNRKCSFTSLILLLLSMENHTLNKEIRRFFKKLSMPHITKSAFIQQRKKLNDDAFPFLFSAMNSVLPFKKTYRGYHLLACDGSDVNVPPLEQDTSTCVASNTSGVTYHQFHLNAVYDILENRYTDILIQPRALANEREAFLTFVNRNLIPGKSIFIGDRGYFSINVLAHLLQADQPFLLRVKADDTAQAFLTRFSLPAVPQIDKNIQVYVTRSHKKKYRDHPEKYVSLTRKRKFDLIQPDDKDSIIELSFRLVKLPLPNGGSEFLVTNLPAKDFSIKDLEELYHLRWGIETSFRYLKCNVPLNSFHSIRRDFLIQETYARVILYNFSMMIVQCLIPPKKDTKYQYKISVSDAISICRDFLLHRIKNAEIEELLCQYMTDVRPGRSAPRKKHSKRYTPLNNRS